MLSDAASAGKKGRNGALFKLKHNSAGCQLTPCSSCVVLTRALQLLTQHLQEAPDCVCLSFRNTNPSTCSRGLPLIEVKKSSGIVHLVRPTARWFANVVLFHSVMHVAFVHARFRSLPANLGAAAALVLRSFGPLALSGAALLWVRRSYRIGAHSGLALFWVGALFGSALFSTVISPLTAGK